MEIWDKIVKGMAVVAGGVAGIFGGWNPLLTILAAVMVIDYLSGVLVAASGHSPKTEGGGVSSDAGFRGLLKKAFIILIVLLATLLDKALGTETMIFQMATACYYVANEGISILENAALLGVPFPDKLRNALEAMKTKGTNTTDE